MSNCTCSGLGHGDWGYHSDNCPVYMTGRIKELESEISHISERLDEILEAGRNIVVLSPLQAAQVAECLRGGSKELRETWATYLLSLPPPPQEKTSE